MNTPINTIDPDGRIVVFEYQKGQDILEFWQTIGNYIEMRNNSNTAKDMFSDLENSENEYTVKMDENDPRNAGVYDPKTKTLTVSTNGEENKEEAFKLMSHEIGHAWRDFHKLDKLPFPEFPDDFHTNSFSKYNYLKERGMWEEERERGAMHLQNRVMKEAGYSLSESYYPITDTEFKREGLKTITKHIGRRINVVENGKQVGTGFKYRKYFQKRLHEDHKTKPIK